MEWLPVWLTNAWRVTLFAMEAWLAANIAFGFLDHEQRIHRLTPERRLCWLCILVFVVQRVIRQIEQFDEPAVYESLPLTTLAVVIGMFSVRAVRKRGEEVC